MSATKSKVDLSLDEIIKSNKKSGKLNERRGAGTSRTGIKRKSTGVLKRKSAGAQKRRSVLNRSNKSNNSKASGATANKAVTQRLVNKLVKKALKRVTVGRAPKVGSVRNVVRSRRGGVRSRGGQTRNVALNRVSQRSRVIGRRSRLVNQSPAAAAALVSSRRGRGDNRRRGTRILQANRREQNPIRAQLNFLRRQQQQSQRQVSRAPAIQQQRRPAPPQQRPQVIYVQQRRPAPVRRQPQQIVVVQQQPRRQFSRGGRRPQRRNNDPFYEPPNFLQRVPVSGGQFYGRGRGGGFGGRF